MRAAVRMAGAAALAAALALAAAAAPVQWSGNAHGAWVRLFVDGQKATGGIRAQLPNGFAEMELAGSGSGTAYRGTLTGTARRTTGPVAVRGEWTVQLAAPAQLRFTVRPQGLPERTVEVPLSRQAGYALLRCAWARGTVTRHPAGGAPRPLAADAPIAVGDTIQTGPASGAVLVLGDRSVVMMEEQSRVVVPAVAENRQGVQKARVDTGKVWFAVRKVQDRTKFEVETEEAVAAVRGTEFLVEVSPDGEFSLTTAEGEVEMRDRTGARKPLAVRAGMRCHLLPPRLRGKGPWRAERHRDLAAVVRRWGPLLKEADFAWPLRREGKARFWQDEHEAGPTRPGPRGPAGRPGMRR